MMRGNEQGPLLRHGVIGVGGIGGVHCRIAAASPDVTLVGVADSDPARIEKAATMYGAAPFADWRDMLASGRLDSVAIATPSLLHAHMAIECMEAGLHVFLEKPIALTLADADRVVETARAKKRVLTVGHQYRVHRLHRTTKKLIEDGAIGRPRQILWTWAQHRDEKYYSHYPWRQNWKDAGGGVTMHSLSHDLNVLTWLIGAPVEVSALAVNQKHDAETEDIMSASVLFEGGALATITASVNRPQSHVVRQIIGERGMIEIPDTQSLTFDHKDHVLLGRFDTHAPPAPAGIGGLTGQPHVQWSPVPLVGDPPKWKKLLERFGLVRGLKPHGLAVLLQSFAHAIRTGGDPIITGEDARGTLEFVRAIYLSAIRGRAVAFPVDRTEDAQLMDELVSGRTQMRRFRG